MVHRTLLVLAFLSMLLVPASAGAAVTVRVELLQPDGTPIPCGSTVPVTIGSVVMNGYATATSSGSTVMLRTTFQGPSGSAWYPIVRHRFPSTTETRFVQIVQDLNPAYQGRIIGFGFGVKAGANTSCTFTPASVGPSEGLKSERSVQSQTLVVLDVVLRDYRTGVPFACGDPSPGGRINASLLAQAPVAGTYDLHLHEERPLPLGTGPDQDAMGNDARWWEGAFDNVYVTSSLAQVGTLVSQLNGVGDNTVHWGQQAADDLDPDPTPTDVDPMTMCHFM